MKQWHEILVRFGPTKSSKHRCATLFGIDDDDSRVELATVIQTDEGDQVVEAACALVALAQYRSTGSIRSLDGKTNLVPLPAASR